MTLSRWTMLNNLSDCMVIFVNPDNIEKYLPGINQLVDGIEVEVRGRLDRFCRHFTPSNRKNIAVKCDVIRSLLLYYYGGVYLDADAIVLDDFNKYFDLLEQHQFIIPQRQSHNKDHMSISFYGSTAKGKIITLYTQAIKQRLSQNKEVAYNELGAGMLTPIVKAHQDAAYIFDESETQPITYENSVSHFLSTDLNPEDILPKEQIIFMLFNDPFQGEMKNILIQDLYHSDMLISKIFRKAIPEEAFNHLLRGNGLAVST
ncbi:hypothetical protein L4C36_03365 [Photobacterium japonica]